MTDLTDNELKALSYYAIGVSSEGGDVAYQLSLAGNVSHGRDGSVFLRPVSNSGYSIGTLQIDLGQAPATAGDLVTHFQSWAKANHPDWLMDSQQQSSLTANLSRDGHHIRDANYDADLQRYGPGHIPASLYPLTGPDIDQTLKSHLNAYLASDDGKSFVHQQDVAQVDRLTTNIGTPLRATALYQNASPDEQARIYATLAKVYNQNEQAGRQILTDARRGRINSLADISARIDASPDYMRTGRDAALQGAKLFIALRDAGETNSMRAPWQTVVADPLVNPTRLDQDPERPHLPDQYATVRGSFVDPAQGRAFVAALEAHGSHDYGNPASPHSRGFYIEGQDFVQWDRDGHGRALTSGHWTEFRRDELTVRRNPDHTLDLDLTRNGQTETLLHVTHPTGSRTETIHPSARVDALQQRLRTLGYLDAAPDGIAGLATRAAIRSFQQDHGLKSDGIAGSHTERALQDATAPKPSHQRVLPSQDIQNHWRAPTASDVRLTSDRAAQAVQPSGSLATANPQSSPAAFPPGDARNLWRAVAARAAPPANPGAASSATTQSEQATAIRLRPGGF